LTLLVGRQEGHAACKKYGGWWRWALVTSPDGVAPIRMADVSASVSLPLHHKVQKFSSGTSSPGWSQKKGRKTLVVVVVRPYCCHGINSNTNDITKWSTSWWTTRPRDHGQIIQWARYVHLNFSKRQCDYGEMQQQTLADCGFI